MTDKPKTRVQVPASELRIPTREELVVLAMDVYRAAMDHQRDYVNSKGDVKTMAEPHYKAACEALSLVSKMCGYADTKGPLEQELPSVDAEQALERMRSKLARKSK